MRVQSRELGISGEGVSIKDIVADQFLNVRYDKNRKYLHVTVSIGRGDVRVLGIDGGFRK